MKNLFFVFAIVILTGSCTDDEKPIEFVLNNTTRGTILRNVERISPNFIYNDFDSRFELLVEQQGKTFDFLRLHLKFVDRDTNGNGTNSQEVIFRDIDAAEFYDGPVDLPRKLISFSMNEAVEAIGLQGNTLRAGDQFELRAEVFLEDGRSFSNDSTSPSLLADSGFFKSPFRYVINLIEPISNNFLTGIYDYEILSEQRPSSTLVSGIANINHSGKKNVRNFSIPGLNTSFTIAGNFLYPKIYGEMTWLCSDTECAVFSGPDENSFGAFNFLDDTVFTFDVIVGYEDWTGDLGVTPPYLLTVRLSKQ